VRISVLVTTWSRPAHLARCLAGVDSQSRPPDEVVVVARENDSETRSLLEKVRLANAPVRSVTVAEQGVVAAMNAGFDAAQGDLVANVDDDAVPRTDWLARIEASLRGDERVGGVGGRDWVHRGDLVENGQEPVVGTVRWYGRLVGNHHLGVGGPREVHFLKGANMSFRAEALDGIRLDERLRVTGAGSGARDGWEIALCLAVRRSGWRLLYDPAVAVDHYPAKRLGGGRDARRDPEAVGGAAHNETYALMRGLPLWHRVVVLAYGLMVGTREAPGVVVFAERLVRGRDLRGSIRLFMAAVRGRLGGLGSALAGRAELGNARAP
jgi:glycosyltransferase involved in cell wall biosynthesis